MFISQNLISVFASLLQLFHVTEECATEWHDRCFHVIDGNRDPEERTAPHEGDHGRQQPLGGTESDGALRRASRDGFGHGLLVLVA